MSFVKVPAAGQYGVNRDLSTHELPINVWTNASNIRFIDGMAAQVLGYKDLYPSPSVIPYHVLPVDVQGVRTWMYAGANKIYTVTNGAVHTNITRQTTGVDVNYSAIPNGWTSSVLGGIPILNNGVDAPQMWLLTGKAQALTNWPANNTAKSLRTYKNSLIALNITKSSTNYPYMVKWSHTAEAGTVPVTWDIADATKDAGEFDLSEGYDTVVDGLPLRDSFIIYKQSSIWRMDYTGGVFVYRFQKIISTQGALARNCVAEVNGQHFVFSNSDCIIHDGQTAVSVLDKQTRRDLFTQINNDYADRCFVFVNRMFNEVLACYPSLGMSIPNKAMVWNYVDKTVSFRDLPDVHHADNGAVDDSSNSTWDSDTTTWDSDNTPWDGSSAQLNRTLSVIASNNQKLFLLDNGYTNNGTAINAFIERKGLSVGEPESVKLIRGVRPRIFGDNGYVNVQVGYGATPYDEPIYNPAVQFNVNSTVSIDSMVTGRYMAIKFSSGTATNWRLDSYDVDVQKAGNW
jgi:hypothetical protein